MSLIRDPRDPGLLTRLWRWYRWYRSGLSISGVSYRGGPLTRRAALRRAWDLR